MIKNSLTTLMGVMEQYNEHPYTVVRILSSMKGLTCTNVTKVQSTDLFKKDSMLSVIFYVHVSLMIQVFVLVVRLYGFQQFSPLIHVSYH